MKHSDVEELARKVGLIEPRDVWADLPADYRQALCSFSALVLEKAADQFELQPHVEMFRPSVAEELRAMSATWQSCADAAGLPINQWLERAANAQVKRDLRKGK